MVKIIFFGTPKIAVPFLASAAKNHEVSGVITRPDRPASRHYKIHSPEIKDEAVKLSIPFFQPEKFTPELIKTLTGLKADVGIVVSYGKLIPRTVFEIPKLGCFNIHFSLLPKYRGAAPVQWALINGEKETGVTSFWIEETLDSGPILVQKPVPIAEEDTTLNLFDKLTVLGLEVMNETLELLKSGKIPGTPQKEAPTLAPLLKKEDGKIDWGKSAGDILNLIRGANPWPGTYTLLQNSRIKITKAVFCVDGYTKDKAGTIVELVKNEGFTVACSQSSIIVKEVQPENKRVMPAWDYIQGGHVSLGFKFN